MKILVTPTSFQQDSKSPALVELQSTYPNLVFNPSKKPLTEDELIPLLSDCDGYIAGVDYITERVLRSCKNLKVISRYGVGYDRVDIAVAKELGIAVTNTPGVNSEAVAELAMAHILALFRRIPYLDRETKAGNWVRSTGTELYGKTIGLIGLGAIGKIVARCAKGFGMKVIAYDPYIQQDYCKENGIGIYDLYDLLAEAHVVTVHVPLNDGTRYIINADTIAHMRDNAIVINVSRGEVLDENAVYEALTSGKLGGLGIDAFEIEPPIGSRLLELDNVVATPHTGAHTAEAVQKMAFAAVKNLMDVLEGRSCKYRLC